MAATEAETFLPTLEGDWYLSDSIFAIEQQRIFGRQWLGVVRAADLAAPGSFETVDVAGENLLLARGHDGALRAFLNVCRHRGSRLCRDERGQIPRTIVCPYHSWSYALDGRLQGARGIQQFTDSERSERGLITVHVREWLGYVWICLATNPPSFEDTVIGQVTTRLGGGDVIGMYGLDELVVARRTDYEVNANWKLLIENYLECTHCTSVHPEFIAVLPEYRNGQSAMTTDGWGPTFGDGIEGFTVDGRRGLDPLPGIDAERARRYYGMIVQPQVVISLVPDHVIFHRIFPVAPNLTRVRCDWLFHPTAIDAGHDLAPSIELFSRVNDQDFIAVEDCQVSMRSRAYPDGGVYMPVEHHIAAFNTTIRDIVTAAD
jgi:Rieske 2Fe-2S family protein